jgi:drug/metabolite transporter (DMT)-like permease
VLLVLGESWWPDLQPEELVRLVFGAVLGISVADTMIAAALNRLGASLQALADCAYAPSIVLVGLLMFGEMLSPWELIGGVLVVSGVFVGAAITAEIKHPRDLWAGIALAASAHVIMAIGILMVRDIYRETSIVWVTGFRFLVASLVMMVYAAIRHPRALRSQLFLGFIRRDTWRTMVPMAILGPFLATLCWVAGFKYLTAGRAAIYNQLSTVFIILLAYVFLKERFTTRKAIGTALALAGSLLVALH